MDMNLDNAYAKEQVWILREIQDTLRGQLSSCNKINGAHAEQSVSLPLLDAQEVAVQNNDPNMLILQKLISLQASIFDKVSIFFQYRLGYTLDFSKSPLNENVSANRQENQCSDVIREERMVLNRMEDLSRHLGLPRALNQYSLLSLFVVGLLKYLNDLEYIRRVSLKIMEPLPEYRQNQYDRLRYKFHKYKMQFKMATKHEAMQRFNSLRLTGANYIELKFAEVNEKTEKYINQFRMLESQKSNPNINVEEQTMILSHNCLDHHREKLMHFLDVFGVEKIPVQSTSQTQENLLVPQEDPSNWTRSPPLSAQPSQSERIASENSMFFSEHDSGDEMTQDLQMFMPLSPGYHSNFGDSSESEEEIVEYDFLNDTCDLSWMNSPPAKRSRRGN